MRRAALLLPLAGLALAATACGERAEPTGATVKLFPVTVTSSSGTITLERRPVRIAACMPDASALVRTVAGTSQAPRVQTIKCQGVPDVQIFAAANARPQIYRISEGSITDVERRIVDVGAILGQPIRARHIVARMESQRREVVRKVENLPRLSVFVDTGFYFTVPQHSLASDIVAQAGGRNVAGSNAGAGPSLGLLRSKNPDFYLATSGSGTTLKDLRKNPRTRTLRAVRDGHFGIVPSSDLFAPGPSVTAGLLAVAKLLHPDAFR